MDQRKCVSFVYFDSESESTFLPSIHIVLSYYLNALTKRRLLYEMGRGRKVKCPADLTSWKNLKTGTVSLLKL